MAIERVAFLGMGIMGSRMAVNLGRGGFDVVIWNRPRERAEELTAEHGFEVADSPAGAASKAQATITMVVDGPHVEDVLGQATPGMDEGHLAIDMSTIPVSTAEALAKRLADKGIAFLDAPVTGSAPRAADGTLTIMAGGSEQDFERARPLFEAMGETILLVGPAGHGQAVKLLNNTVAAINAAALAEAFTAAEARGVDLDSLMEVMRSGSGGSTMLELKGGPMAEHDFRPLFKLAHMLKDVRHTIRESGVPLTLAETAEKLYSEADAAGHGEDDFAAVITATERQ
ncbi:MAG: NAD(P)-dependent oxidoreductase [Thermoleophilaceae bacterium]|nr:NAD(P)-dependent oxidoreductase [Thermoleophilaceae bacterium]